MANFNSAATGLFQFTPLREGRPASLPSVRTISQFQFTPLREGRQQPGAVRGTGGLISIHAPAGGATRVLVCGLKDVLISIHAPAGGATAGLCQAQRACVYFNSRPCGRGDDSRRPGTARRFISIHAPAGGATLSAGCPTKRRTFQFTPLREGRLYGLLFVVQPWLISIHAPAGGATYHRYRVAKAD